MVHFLRTTDNRTIIECEVYNNDLSAAVNIHEYSKMLIDLHNKDLHHPFIKTMSDLSEIRGWWWEMARTSYSSIDEFVADQFKQVAIEYNLNYITD